jgi:hypothetical protein
MNEPQQPTNESSSMTSTEPATKPQTAIDDTASADKVSNARSPMNIEGAWAGNIVGTNTGKVFAEFEQDQSKVTGTLRLNDDALGIGVFTCTGTSDDEIELLCLPQEAPDGMELPETRVLGSVLANGNFRGRWETNAGTAGLLILFPHKVNKTDAEEIKIEPEQIYNRVAQLGSMRLFRDDVKRLLDLVGKGFNHGRLIVTYENQGNEITQWREDFLKSLDDFVEFRSLGLFIQEAGLGSVNKSVNINLPATGENILRVSGPDDTWVIGKAESLRRALSAFENRVITNYRKHGLNINSLIFVGMLVVMPSIPGILRRGLFGAAILLILWALFAIHTKLIPNTLILLRAKPKGPLVLAWPSILSWIIGLTASLVASVIFWLLTRP